MGDIQTLVNTLLQTTNPVPSARKAGTTKAHSFVLKQEILGSYKQLYCNFIMLLMSNAGQKGSLGAKSY